MLQCHHNSKSHLRTSVDSDLEGLGFHAKHHTGSDLIILLFSAQNLSMDDIAWEPSWRY